MKIFLIILFSLYSIFAAADPQPDPENPPVLNPAQQINQQANPHQGINPNRYWYDRCEYHWWNMSACGLRIFGGGFAHTIHGLASIGSFTCVTLLATDSIPLDSNSRMIVGIVGGVCVVTSLVAKKISDSAMSGAERRERYALDIEQLGHVPAAHFGEIPNAQPPA